MVYLSSFVLSVTLCAIEIRRFHWNLALWGLPVGRTNFWRWSGPWYEFRITFPLSHQCRIGGFSRFISISHTYTHWRIFTTLGAMTDANKVMNPQHFGSDPAYMRIRIRGLIRKFGFETLIFLWAQSISILYLNTILYIILILHVVYLRYCRTTAS